MRDGVVTKVFPAIEARNPIDGGRAFVTAFDAELSWLHAPDWRFSTLGIPAIDPGDQPTSPAFGGPAYPGPMWGGGPSYGGGGSGSGTYGGPLSSKELDARQR